MSRPVFPAGTNTTGDKTIKKFLSDPKTIIVGVVAGGLFGHYFKVEAQYLAPFANIYIALLSMCMLPIMVSALMWGIAQLLRNPKTANLFQRFAISYVLLLFIPCIAGLGVALIFEPGAGIDQNSAATLGSQMSQTGDGGGAVGFLAFVQSIIPPNVFGALSKGQFIAIVFFTALVGLALGVVKSDGADETLRMINTLYQTFVVMFGWVLLPLPIGLFCIVSVNIAQVNPELLDALIKFVVYFYLACTVAFVIHYAITVIVARSSIGLPFKAFKTPWLIAFATDNPFVALYSSMEALREYYGVDREVANTVAPFGVFANQHGQVLLFAFTTVFLAQVYGVELSVGALIQIAIGTMIAGTAAVGGGAILVPIMAPILLGVGVPPALAIIIFATTQTIIASFVSLLTVMATCNLAILTAQGSTDESGEVAEAPSPVTKELAE